MVVRLESVLSGNTMLLTRMAGGVGGARESLAPTRFGAQQLAHVPVENSYIGYLGSNISIVFIHDS
jgi:hypothetical protein